MNNNNLENLDDLISTLNQAKKAHDLLEKIWTEIGPYGCNSITNTQFNNQKVLFELQNYFDFDDSE